MTFIKESYYQTMSLVDAEKLVLQVLKNVMEEKITNENIEIAVVKTDTKKLEFRSQEYVQPIIDSLS